MFLDFFLLLKNDGIPVTLKEYLDLLHALDEDLGTMKVDDFYTISRMALVKRDEHLDRFDVLFGHYFKGIELIPDHDFLKIPEEWLRKDFERMLTDEEKAAIKAMGGLDKLIERLKALMKEQKERHSGGGKWIGTGGTSPFGAYGYNPEGIRIGQDGSRHRRAVKVWDKREFRNLRGDADLETRNMKMALRRLRVLTREGNPEELDLEATIRETARKGHLQLEMVPPRTNQIKVLLLMDIGGSMDDHILQLEQLFTAARYEFRQLEYFYFHNCLYDFVWTDNSRRWQETIPTWDIINKYNSDYRLIFVGDASMSPYEVSHVGGSVEYFNEEPGYLWLQRMLKQFPNAVWLNPVPVRDWDWTTSIGMIRKLMEQRMFPLTLDGISAAVEELG